MGEVRRGLNTPQERVCAQQRGWGDRWGRTQSRHSALASLTSRHTCHSTAGTIRPWAVAEARGWMLPSEDKGQKE